MKPAVRAAAIVITVAVTAISCGHDDNPEGTGGGAGSDAGIGADTGGSDTDGGTVGDGGPDSGTPDARSECEPQVAIDDPEVDCDEVICDPTPVQWTGGLCRLSPVSCACTGSDCDKRFATLDECEQAFSGCPHNAEIPGYEGARLRWYYSAGIEGSGPTLMIDGVGRTRFWERETGSPEWDQEDPTATVNLGVEFANELFSALESMDFSELPHPSGTWAECYPRLKLILCDGCQEKIIDYVSAPDLLPEFEVLYTMLFQRLCQTVPGPALPGEFCVLK